MEIKNLHQKNINSLSMDGRLVILAMLGGFKMEQTNIISILKKRLTIKGATLRNRNLEYKINLNEKIKNDNDLTRFVEVLSKNKENKNVVSFQLQW